jgi:putative phosphonate catabolism associated alcohol dehydrogenase
MITARALWFAGVDRPLDLVTLTCRSPQAGEVLVRVRACGVCASDLHTLRGRRTTPQPCVLGHEAVGEIVALAPDVAEAFLSQRLSVGSRVVWTVCTSCGQCSPCRRGHPQKCVHGQKFGHVAQRSSEPPRGGFASHALLAPGTAVAAVPDSLDDRVAALATCAGATAMAALRVAGDLQGRSVLVHGGGLLGVLTALSALDRGASSVTVCERDVRRSQQVTAICPEIDVATPDNVFDRIATLGDGVDLAFDCTGDPRAIADQHRLLAIGGTQVLLGSVMPSAPFATEPQVFVRRLLTLRGVHNYAPNDLIDALDWLRKRQDHLLPFLGPTLPLDHHGDAVAVAERGEFLRVFLSAF